MTREDTHQFVWTITQLDQWKPIFLIIDKHTHYHWVEFLQKKSNVFVQLQCWKLQAEREVDLKLHYLKSNGGMEFSSKVFTDWLATDGVTHEVSTPYEHKQNGLAEQAIQNVSQ